MKIKMLAVPLQRCQVRWVAAEVPVGWEALMQSNKAFPVEHAHSPLHQWAFFDEDRSLIFPPDYSFAGERVLSLPERE